MMVISNEEDNLHLLPWVGFFQGSYSNEDLNSAPSLGVTLGIRKVVGSQGRNKTSILCSREKLAL